MNISTPQFPIAVIGAGPVGLAAAAHLAARGLAFVVLERGAAVGASLRQWGHVRTFSPWRYNVDAAARALLEQSGWAAPDPDGLPTGDEIVDDYLVPLAALPPIAPNLIFDARVTAITRLGSDKVRSPGRERSPFRVRFTDSNGAERMLTASAVIDASGTWTSPNPMGADGLAVIGEAAAASRIAYAIPDVSGSARPDYDGSRVLVVGGGHSAINVILALLDVQATAPDTRIFWALRRDSTERALGGGTDDQLPARGALGLAARRAIEEGKLEVLAPFAAERIALDGDVLAVDATLAGAPFSLEVDRIVVATGFRPDLSILRELRITLDPAVEAPPALAPLIDPNLHSCGTVRPHGIEELVHPEPGFVIAGSKAYGRAPTFLMATGYEQVRSIAAEWAGDHEAARQVQLVLPETGVCSSSPAPKDGGEAADCCGGPAPAGVSACCVADAQAKADGKSGCGCGAPAPHARQVPVPA